MNLVDAGDVSLPADTNRTQNPVVSLSGKRRPQTGGPSIVDAGDDPKRSERLIEGSFFVETPDFDVEMYLVL